MKPTGLKEFAYNSIKKMLLDGKIKPGDRVMEADLAEEISVSRTPVREAINQLVAAGFIIEKPRHGLFAVKFTEKQLKDIGTVRSALSMLAFDQCCEFMDEEKAELLTEAYQAMVSACESGDFSAVSRADGQFHKTIAQLTGNDTLYSYICDLEDLSIYSRQMDNYVYNKEHLLESHSKMYHAILSRDRDYADSMMSWKNVQNRFQPKENE